MNKNIIIAILLLIILATSVTLVAVELSENYEIVSNEELYNITQDAYLQGTLYTWQTGNIIHLVNNTIQQIEVAEVCYNLNNQEAKE